MLMDARLLLTAFTLIVGGCGGDGSTSNLAEKGLVGSWITPSCEKVNEDTWTRSIYTFSEDNKILLDSRAYDTDACLEVREINHIGDSPNIYYQDQGPLLLPENIEGSGIVISVDTTANDVIAVNGYYTFFTNSLCFSEVYTFKPTLFGIAQSKDLDIDFDNCLVPFTQ